jgi:hypothetical protein
MVRKFSLKLKDLLLFVLDISTDKFPADYLERGAIFFKNHDINNYPIREFYCKKFLFYCFCSL